jgi:hypothetical protein
MHLFLIGANKVSVCNTAVTINGNEIDIFHVDNFDFFDVKLSQFCIKHLLDIENCNIVRKQHTNKCVDKGNLESTNKSEIKESAGAVETERSIRIDFSKKVGPTLKVIDSTRNVEYVCQAYYGESAERTVNRCCNVMSLGTVECKSVKKNYANLVGMADGKNSDGIDSEEHKIFQELDVWNIFII